VQNADVDAVILVVVLFQFYPSHGGRFDRGILKVDGFGAAPRTDDKAECKRKG